MTALLKTPSPILWKVLLPAACIVLGLVLSSDRPLAQASDDHGDYFTTATNLPLGSSVSGRIDHGEDWDIFKLDLSDRSGSTDVWVYTTGNLDTIGSLYDSSRALLVYNGNALIGDQSTKFQYKGTNFHLRWVLPRGVYYVGVRGQLDRETDRRPTGDYRLHAQVVTDPGSTRSTAKRLALDSMAPGTIDTARDADYFRVDLSGSTNLVFHVKNLFLWYKVDDESSEMRPYATLDVEVLDARGAEVSTNLSRIGRESPHGFWVWDDFEPGTYYFKVTTPADVISQPMPYTIHAYEDTAYTKFIEDCTAATRALNNPQIRDPLYACQWHLNGRGSWHVNVESAWAQGINGEGVNVAVVDDGMYHTHEDLRDNVDASRNHDYTGGGDIHTPLGHHGTHVTGVIAARDNGIGVRGIAPRATVYGYNYLAGSTNLNAADAMARHQATTAVSNNSWGPKDGPGLSEAGSFWERAVESGLDTGYGGKGVLYVFGGGNGHEEGDDSNLNELANFYGVATVCAVNDHDKRSSYSEMGANLWVCAPSNDRSDLHQGILTTENSNRYYEEFSGTSAAAPIVAGVAALMRDANPDLTWRDLKLILAATARKNDPRNAGWGDGARKYGVLSASDRYHFNREYGFGVVDAGAAVDLAKRWIIAPPLQESSASSGGGSIPAPGSRGPVTVAGKLNMSTSIRFTEFVEVEVDFDHTSFRDMDIELESPSGAISKLTVPYDTREMTDDEGETLYIRLDGKFRFGAARHLGEDPNGEWKLRLTDTIAPHGGTLRSWSIRVYGHSGTPTLPAPGTPTPTPDVPTSDDVVRRIHCQPDDFAAAFGEKYDMDDEGLYHYDRNGRGLWETLTTRWVSSVDSGRVVMCRTKVYDNISSAIFDNYYATMANEVSGSYDVLRQYKRCCEEIGQAFRGLILNIGRSAAIGDTVQWRDTVSYRVAVSGFRQRQVIVQVAVYDEDAYYIGSSDAMARRVESRFDDTIFDQIATRQQASRSEGRVGVPLSEDSLHLAPQRARP